MLAQPVSVRVVRGPASLGTTPTWGTAPVGAGATGPAPMAERPESLPLPAAALLRALPTSVTQLVVAFHCLLSGIPTSASPVQHARHCCHVPCHRDSMLHRVAVYVAADSARVSRLTQLSASAIPEALMGPSCSTAWTGYPHLAGGVPVQCCTACRSK